MAGLVALSVVGIQPAASQSSDNERQVQICHATSSHSNPYVSNHPAVANNGDIQGGHLDHLGPVFPAADWGDIIPPYEYADDKGVTQHFPGYNWTPRGQEIWQNGCDSALRLLVPLLRCVDPTPGGGFVAHFGYRNPNSDDVVKPFENAFDPAPADRGQPTAFRPGTVGDAFQVASTGGPLTWRLTDNEVTASKDSTPSCRGSITIVKVIHPASDGGRFHLEIDHANAGDTPAVGDGGTTGTIAVSPGDHTVGESPAEGTKLADYATQILCVSGGTTVAEAGTPSLTVPVAQGAHVLCTITNTRKSELKPLVPMLECVVFRGNTPEQAVWGYRNDNAFAVQRAIGPENGFTPSPADRGQPQTFEPGRWTGTFQTPFGGSQTLTWTLAGQTAAASSTSPRCTAIIEIRKVVAPANDPGVFNLLLDGQVLATGGNGTTAGPYTIGVGEGSVSETAGQGTKLADYESSVSCTRNGTVEVSTTGTKVDGAVGNGDVVVCTFTNRRITTPPTPVPPEPPLPPVPPTQPDPPPTGPPPTPGPLADLKVEKRADPTTAVIGEHITWTITVSNLSSVEAADVNVVRLSEESFRTKVLSVTPSQGTCSLAGCDLGRIAPGGSTTITVVTLANQIGEIVNTVRVGSEEEESDYLNNVASNIVRVVGPFTPPALQAACRTLGAAPTQLRVGTTSIVLARARDRFGVAVPGVTVHASGPGIRGTAKTDARGIARFTVTPTASGFVAFQGTQRSPATAKPVCATFLAALTTGVAGSVTG
jgi:hypothetical protein